MVVVSAVKRTSTLLCAGDFSPGAEREAIAVATSNLSMSAKLPSADVWGAGAPDLSLDNPMTLTYHSGRE
jgi:hypothetical protein